MAAFLLVLGAAEILGPSLQGLSRVAIGADMPAPPRSIGAQGRGRLRELTRGAGSMCLGGRA